MKKKIIIIGLVILIIFIGLIAFRIHERNARSNALKNMVKQATPVTVQPPKYGRITDVLSTTGTLVSPNEIQIFTKVTGRLISLKVDEGSTVYAGQIIGEIDHSETDAQITQAQAQATTAKANFLLQVNGPLAEQIKQAKASVLQAEANLRQLQANKRHVESDFYRYQQLANQDVISKQQLETSATQLEAISQQVKAAEQQVISASAALKILTDGTRPEQVSAAKGQLEQANATIKLYKAQLDNYFIKSPINGVVSKRNFNVGSLVGPAIPTPLVTIIQNNQLELNMNIPERELSNIRIGQPVEITTPAIPNQVIITSIKEISPAVDIQTRLVKVKAIINTKLPLKTGMMVNCLIIFAQKANALLLPAEAIIMKNNKSIVYVAVKDKVYEKLVTIGLRTPVEVEIINGVKPNDQVIIKGNSYVKPGDSVKIQADTIKYE